MPKSKTLQDTKRMEALLRRREVAMAKFNKAVARCFERNSENFKRELGSIVVELEGVASALKEDNAEALEQSRSWRFVGDAYFDLARGTDKAYLQQVIPAYLKSELALAALDAPLDRAKLDFNFANTLRGLSGGSDRALLEEARLRYQLALATFAELAPQHAPMVQANLQSLQTQLTLLGAFEGSRAGLEELGKAYDELKQHPHDVAIQKHTRELLGKLRSEQGLQLAAATRALQDSGRQAPAGVAEQLGHMIGQLQSVAGAGNDAFQRLLPLLLSRFQSEVEAGRVKPEREAALRPLLQSLQELINEPAYELEVQVRRLGRLRELMGRLSTLLATPSVKAPPEGSRAEAVFKLVGQLAEFLAEDQRRPMLPSGEREAGRDLFERLAAARGAQSARSLEDTVTVGFEHDVLRPLALEIEHFGARAHLTLARPFWAVPVAAQDPNALYVHGAGSLRTLIDEIAGVMRLRIVQPASEVEAGLATWNAIWTGRVAVFDLRALTGVPLAAACYEIGLARALGRRLVVALAPGATLPFDIEVSPVAMRGEKSDREQLARALDEALYGSPSKEAGSSLAVTVGELSRQVGTTAVFSIRKTLELVQAVATDAVEVRRRIESLLGFLGPDAPCLLQPAWPGAYPGVRDTRVFHVMPFGQPWSTPVRELAAAACAQSGARYVRGDEVPDARVIRSIWDEIARASHVLVDLTGFNANVALELGLAHGLGRRCLVVGQGETVQQLFPAIRKVRVLPYELNGEAPKLVGAIRVFVNAR